MRVPMACIRLKTKSMPCVTTRRLDEAKHLFVFYFGLFFVTFVFSVLVWRRCVESEWRVQHQFPRKSNTPRGFFLWLFLIFSFCSQKWEYDPRIGPEGEWRLLSGSNDTGFNGRTLGVYGVQGYIPDSTRIPRP